MLIDFHTHVLSPRIRSERAAYASRDAGFALVYADEKAVIATAEELVESMDREGVDLSVIVNYGWTTHSLCVETNDYIMEAVARYPGRLAGFGAVIPGHLDAAAEMERCARGGLTGIGELRPDTQSFDITDAAAMQPFVAALRQHNLVLMLHASEPVGHVYPGKGSVTPDKLYAFITAFPGLPLVLAHWGGGLPFYALMPEVRQAMEDVYFDSAASPFLYRPEVYRYVADFVGADRILFGTDYPLLPPGRLLRELEGLNLSAEEKGMLLAGNAARLLGLRE